MSILNATMINSCVLYLQNARAALGNGAKQTPEKLAALENSLRKMELHNEAVFCDFKPTGDNKRALGHAQRFIDDVILDQLKLALKSNDPSSDTSLKARRLLAEIDLKPFRNRVSQNIADRSAIAILVGITSLGLSAQGALNVYENALNIENDTDQMLALCYDAYNDNSPALQGWAQQKLITLLKNPVALARFIEVCREYPDLPQVQHLRSLVNASGEYPLERLSNDLLTYLASTDPQNLTAASCLKDRMSRKIAPPVNTPSRHRVKPPTARRPPLVTSTHTLHLETLLPGCQIPATEPVSPLLPYILDSHEGQSRGDGFRLANLVKPAPNQVRLVTNAIINHAIGMVPPWLLDTALSCLPPFAYARFPAPPQNTPTMLTINESFVASHNGSSQEFVWTQISLSDIRLSLVDTGEKLRDILFTPELPTVFGNIPIRAFNEADIKLLKKNCPHINPEDIEVNKANIEASLTYHLLYEIAQPVWRTLPEYLKNRWKDLFPIKPSGTEKSGIYWRNQKRLWIHRRFNAEFTMHDFHEAVFSDFLALYWLGEHMLNMHKRMNEERLQSLRPFLDEVMSLLESRRKDHGSAFIRLG